MITDPDARIATVWLSKAERDDLRLIRDYLSRFGKAATASDALREALRSKAA